MNNKKLILNLFQKILYDDGSSHLDTYNFVYDYAYITSENAEVILKCERIFDDDTNLQKKELSPIRNQLDLCEIKIDTKNNSLNIKRNCFIKSDMHFSLNKTTSFCHNSGFGNLYFDLYTLGLAIENNKITIKYNLLNNHKILSKNLLTIEYTE